MTIDAAAHADIRAQERRWHRNTGYVCCGVTAMIVVSVLMSLDADLWHYAWMVLALTFASMAGRSAETAERLASGQDKPRLGQIKQEDGMREPLARHERP